MQNIHLYTNGAEAKGQNPNSGAVADQGSKPRGSPMFTGWLQGPGEKMSPMGDQNENVKKMGSPEVAPTGDICSHTCCVHLLSVYTQLQPR